MNISERILHQRKIKGLSQEELADKIGVSRQAVSKWESEQSIPDIDKVVLMSELFEVSSDYLLRGIEAEKSAKDLAVSAYLYVALATFLNYAGVVTTLIVWYEEKSSAALLVGAIFLGLGGLMFSIGYLNADKDQAEAKRLFWQINIWGLIFIPLALIYNSVLFGSLAPYPLWGEQRLFYGGFWIVYLFCGLAVTLSRLNKKYK